MTGKGDATGRMDLTAPSSPPADSDKYVEGQSLEGCTSTERSGESKR